MAALQLLSLPLALGDSPQHASASSGLAFSAGFTDDAVLQRAPAKAAIYGLAPAGTTGITVTVASDAADAAPYTVDAQVAGAAGGTSDPLCQARCLDAGHCCLGQISACQKPSCAMGCIIAGRAQSVAECKASCAAAANASSGCTFNVVSPAGEHKLPQDTLWNQSLQMCDNGPILSNGTQCSSCDGPECEAGCEFGDPTQAKPAVWKALLRPAAAGGSYTITVKAGSLAPISLRRVTHGDVFFCSGQSNMDLALQYTFSKPQLDKDVAAGKYDNVRLFQYGDMGVKFEETTPTWVTTTGTIHDPTDAGGTWANLTTASKPNPAQNAPAAYNLLSQFSATCFYCATLSPLPPLWLFEKSQESPC